MTFSDYVQCALQANTYSRQDQEIAVWRSAIDQLFLGKITWEEFLQGMTISDHPAKMLTTTEDGQSLLHLAVLANRIDLVEELCASDPHLKLRRDRIGLTPFDLAQFLPRRVMISLLKTRTFFNFHNAPNVIIQNAEDFEKFRHLMFFSRPMFSSEKIFAEVLKLAKRAKQEDKIPSDRIWMGIYFAHEIQEGIHPKVSIRFIDKEVGFGAFAEQKISPCAFSGEYTGMIQKRKKKELKENVHCVRYTIWGKSKENFVINAEGGGNFTRFINHSSKPNLTLQSVYVHGIPRMIFVALKEISVGEQLTFDYGPIFWKTCQAAPKLFM